MAMGESYLEKEIMGMPDGIGEWGDILFTCIDLTYCGLDKMAAISQMTFSWMEIYGFR